MSKLRQNWYLRGGFLLFPVSYASYFLVFAGFPVTRDIPWVNFLLFAIGFAFLFFGLKRAFAKPQLYHGKIAGPIASLVSIFVVAFFCFSIYHQTRQLPASASAPRIGQKAPEFVLPDTNNQPMSLSSLLSTPLATSQAPPKGVLLVFYRGYW
jgi:hypothetical protein